MKIKDFKQDCGHLFSDISSEQYRVYEFCDKSIRIENPLLLSVSASGGHRVWDAKGVSHYIPSGFRHIFWEAKEGQPHFVK